MQVAAGTERAVNDVIRHCRDGNDLASLEADVLRTLRKVMPVDAAFFATADPETLLFSGFHAEEPLASVAAQLLENELVGGDVNRFAALARSPQHVASLDAATADNRMASARYRDIMRPLGLGDEVRVALVIGSACWGYLCLHREDASSGFTEHEVDTLGRLAPHIARAVRQAMLRQPQPGGTPRSGVVLLDDSLEVVASTPEADEMLAMVRPDARLPVPPVVFAVAAALKDAERRNSTPPSVRTRAATGYWLDVHAARLTGSDDPRIAVVIAPAEQQSVIRILLSAYGLSAREQDVTALILRGESTKEICAALHISAHTVQDHLKNIFDKTGVRSRRDLVAQLLGGH